MFNHEHIIYCQILISYCIPLPIPCICTADKLTMQEWIAVIDAAIEGVPEQVHRRRQTVNKVFAMRYKDKVQTSNLFTSFISLFVP